MEGTVSLPNTEAMNIYDGSARYHGGDQEWYVDYWQQRAGCGPTSCANIMYYLARMCKGCEPLCPHDASKKAGFVQLMEDVWQYVTPGKRGVNTTDIFVNGAERYGETKGVALTAKALPIARIYRDTRDHDKIMGFVANALERGLPVAFLNLSAGSLENLDRWHWVTIVAMDGENAMIYDQGKARWIHLLQWLRTSVLGGGFVVVEPPECR